MRVDQAGAMAKLAALRALLAAMDGALVAFSGGADSALLVYVAHEVLGARAGAVTADSPSLARAELEGARAFARRFGIDHRVVATGELADERYARNAGDRCYFCKDALMRALRALAAEAGGREILVGVNTDDLRDHRPGQRAVKELGGRWPLVEAGLAKAEVRWLSRELGLPTWDKPAAACLSSRLAYGVPVTAAALRRVELAEAGLRAAGLGGQVRVRDQGGDLARIETDPDRATLAAVLERRDEIVAALRAAGFTYVTLDLEGYRQGSHNAVLRLGR